MGDAINELLGVTVNEPIAVDGTALTQFTSMLKYVCSRSEDWAIFFLCDCDDYAVTLRLDVDEMVKTVERFFVEEPEELLAGFVIMQSERG